MSNLLAETIAVLREYNKTLADIQWVGDFEGHYIPVHRFIELANADYDGGFGSPKVPEDLVVCGDNWWLERGEYDGSEWWEYKTMPIEPDTELNVRTLTGGMWSSLWSMSEDYDKYEDMD